MSNSSTPATSREYKLDPIVFSFRTVAAVTRRFELLFVSTLCNQLGGHDFAAIEATVLGRRISAFRRYPSEAIKRIIGGRRRAEKRADKRVEQHAEFLRSCHGRDSLLSGAAFPAFVPEQWPSGYHHKCDVEFCGNPNKPRSTPGVYRCEFPACPGNFVVTPEMAAAVKLNKRRCAVKKKITNLRDADSDVLWGMGASALESRSVLMRSQASVKTVSTVATAPTMIHFPRARQDSEESHQGSGEELPSKGEKKAAPPIFVPNPLHPEATSTRRPPRPSLPPPVWERHMYNGKYIDSSGSPLYQRTLPGRAKGQRLASQPMRPIPTSYRFVDSGLAH
ncbi:hypothetical protein GGX14DRAFT_419150 [Mycena pura]|uniref:Uncharacterized protein n=1 Tax=Mycena pura TaxID=153505 RepID=A0AAD6YRU4_9AGAR|nr:hypothetical protein GGX14DRAFT_419150 [Mycena pura]